MFHLSGSYELHVRGCYLKVSLSSSTRAKGTEGKCLLVIKQGVGDNGRVDSDKYFKGRVAGETPTKTNLPKLQINYTKVGGWVSFNLLKATVFVDVPPSYLLNSPNLR